MVDSPGPPAAQAAGGLGFSLGDKRAVPLLEGVRDVLEEDEAERDVLVLGRVHVAAHLVGRRPQLLLEADGGAVLLLWEPYSPSTASLVTIAEYGAGRPCRRPDTRPQPLSVFGPAFAIQMLAGCERRLCTTVHPLCGTTSEVRG